MSDTDTRYDSNISSGTRTLVLGSWGLFGVGHCGVLTKLNEVGKLNSFSALIGSGSGCIILGLLMCRVPISEISDICMNLTKTISPSILSLCTGSLIDRSRILDTFRTAILSHYHKIPTLQELYDETKILLVFSAYSLTDRNHVNIRYSNYPDMTILDAILASTSIPILYPTFHYRGKAYSDSTLSNPYPTDIVKNGTGIGISFNLPLGCVTNDNMMYFANYLLSPIGSLQRKNQSTKRYDHIIVTTDSIIGSVKDYQKGYNTASDYLNADCIRDY